MALQLEVRCYEKQDKNGDYYLIGGSNIPASVKLDEVTFIIFYPEDNSTVGTLLIRPKNDNPKHRRNRSDRSQHDDEDRDDDRD
jgi:hypothetical protein